VVTAPGRNHAPEIKVFNGSPLAGQAGQELTDLSLSAAETRYGVNFVNGLSVAVGDVNGDGAADIVAVPTRGQSLVQVYQNGVATGTDWVRSRRFDAFAGFPNFTGGATLAVADLDGSQDGNSRADILVASGPGIRARVRVFDVTAPAGSYLPIRQILHPNANFRSGWSVTTGDVNGDQFPDIITGAGPLGNSWVRVYDGRPGASATPLNAFQAFPADNCGLRVLARDIDDDGRAEVLAAQCPDSPSSYEVRRFEPLTGQLVDSFFARHSDFTGGGLFLG
jgi:serralysin